jgi:hypothetical protein
MLRHDDHRRARPLAADLYRCLQPLVVWVGGDVARLRQVLAAEPRIVQP